MTIAKQIFGVSGLAALVAIGLAAPRSPPSSSDRAATVAPQPPASPCATNWNKCADNADLAAHYEKYDRAKRECKMAANAQAKYGEPKWQPGSWFIFTRHLKGDDYVKTGIARLGDNDVQFQNVFGSMVNSFVDCTYNLSTQKVIGVTIEEKQQLGN